MSVNFIAVHEAKELIRENTIPLPFKRLPLELASGLITATDIFATVDIPSYPQSSMDGYALSFAGWEKFKTLRIEGEYAAGSDEWMSLAEDIAARIFTGAPVPIGTDTVVMQEHTRVVNGRLTIDSPQLVSGMHVRPKGSEIKSGDLAIAKQTLLTPAAIGFLAGIGYDQLNVFPLPRVSLVITGNELQDPGMPLRHGQVYEANSYALKSALRQMGIHELSVFRAADTLEILASVLANAMENADVVLLTGGASVGDYDFVLQAAENCGVEPIFHKIKQRPGKPLFFGKRENKLVFGLPGNPASVMTCFYEYVLPALAHLSNQNLNLRKLNVQATKDFKKLPGLTHFLKGLYDGETVSALQAQESYRMSSFANANCLIQVNENSTGFNQGDTVEIHLLPK